MRFSEWLLSEARIMFNKDDLEREYEPKDNANYRVAYVYITKDGEVRLGTSDTTGRPRRFEAEAKLWPDEKLIDLKLSKSTGIGLNPKDQQLLAALMKSGFVDNTWKVRERGISNYIGSQYINHPGPRQNTPIATLASRSNRIDASTTNLTFYHGTSTKDLERIMKTGLVSHSVLGAEPGYESRGKHQYNKNHLYLCGDVDCAYNYAKTRARDMNKKYTKGYYSGYSECDYPIKPVILKVTIPDPYKLRADDDVANSLLRGMADRMWKQVPQDEKVKIMKDLSAERGWEVNEPSVAKMLWRERDDVVEAMLKRLPKKIWTNWLLSLHHHKQVAYAGRIPPNYLEVIDPCSASPDSLG